MIQPLMFVICMIHLSKSMHVIFPIQELSAPEPVKLHNPQCLHSPSMDSKYNEIHLDLTSPVPSFDSYKAVGYLCNKQSWSTKCVEGFFGGQEIISSVSTIEIGRHECAEAVNDYKAGKQKTPMKPNPVCGWYSTNTASKTYIVVTPHIVSADRYNLHYIDPIFKMGWCSNYICSTYYSNILWFTYERVDQICHDLTFKSLLLESKTPFDQPSTFVSSQYIPKTDLIGACKEFNYCNITGFLTKRGYFFSVEGQVNHDLIDKTLQSLPYCDESRKIILNNPINEVELSSLRLEELMYLDKCSETKNKIREGQQVSRYDLSYMNPMAPGVGHGYKIIKDTVRVGKYRYSEIQGIEVDCTSCNNCSVIVESFKEKITVTHHMRACSCQNFSGCDLGNGFLAYHRQLLNPKLHFFEDFYYDWFNIRHSIIYDKHLMPHPDEEKDGIEMTITDPPTHLSSNVGGVMTKFSSNLKSYIFQAILYFIFSMALIYILRWYLCSPIQSKPRTDNHDIMIPLHNIR